jgi:tetratricopeptide (TPR) repeat protein
MSRSGTRPQFRPTSPGFHQSDSVSSQPRPSPSSQTGYSRPEPTESYAVGYFREHPEIQVDKRSPIEKLEEIDAKLGETVDKRERLTLLVQRKSLCFLAYGEESLESIESLRALGHFYNEIERPDNALRHLTKAYQITKAVDLPQNDAFALAIELAGSYSSSQGEGDRSKQLSRAEAVLSPYLGVECDDPNLCYERDLLLARIAASRRKYKDALALYLRITKSLEEEAKEARPKNEIAALYAEIGECAEAAGDFDTGGKMYAKAYPIFLEVEMPEAAALIESKLPADFPRAEPG